MRGSDDLLEPFSEEFSGERDVPWERPLGVSGVVDGWEGRSKIWRNVALHERLAPTEARFAPFPETLSPRIVGVLQKRGLSQHNRDLIAQLGQALFVLGQASRHDREGKAGDIAHQDLASTIIDHTARGVHRDKAKTVGIRQANITLVLINLQLPQLEAQENKGQQNKHLKRDYAQA